MAIALPIISFCILFASFHKMLIALQRSAKLALFFLSVLGCIGTATSARAQAATSTSLTLTAGGNPATSVSSGTVVTLTATVKAGQAPVTAGQVKFCDALAAYCTDIHIAGMAQLTASGRAIVSFRPGIGSHSYKAVFKGTKSNAGSSSGTASVTVTGTSGIFATTTSIAKTGSWGSYALTATVTETGGLAPLTGTVSFPDTSYQNAVLGSGSLGVNTAGLAWVGSQVPNVYYGADAIASSDLNGDGIPDLAVVNGHASSIAIYLGQGDGTFTPATNLETGVIPASIVVVDFNGDGNEDIAVVNTGNGGIVGPGSNYNSVSIFLGHGDGTFTATAVSPATDPFPTSLTTGDFNNDGVPDLAVVNTGGSLMMFLGNGDGTFTAGPGSSVGGFAFAITTGDFNGDGNADLAIGTDQAVINILLGNGDGTFTAAASPSITSYSMSIKVGDFNGDGKLDIAAANGTTLEDGPTTIAIFLGNGDGTFTGGPADPAFNGDATDIAIGDFNEDGKPDLAAAGGYLSGVAVLLGNGDGTFTSDLLSPSLFNSPQTLTVSDFNGDGRADIAVADQFDGSVPVLLTEPTQTAMTEAIPVTPIQEGNHLAAASYGGDSNYITSISGATTLWGQVPSTTTSLAIAAGGSAVTTVASGTAITLTASVVAGGNPLTSGLINFCDASANDCTDIHLLGSASLSSHGTASFTYIPGPGSHSYKAILLQNAFGATSSSSAAVLTVNAPPVIPLLTETSIAQSGDAGNYTLVATVTGVGSTTIAPTGSVSFLDTSYQNAVLGTASLGAGVPGLTWLHAQSTSIGNSPNASATGDFNRDGKPDLAILDQNASSVAILLGNGDGTFAPMAHDLSIGSNSTAILAQDLNADGILDLAVTISGSTANGAVAIFFGNGDGSFTAATSTAPVVGYPDSLVAADFNGDGITDLIVASYDQPEVTVLLGHGDGSFTQSISEPVPSSFSHAMVAADLNGDHIQDVVIEDGLGNVEVLLGNGDGTFQATPPMLLANLNSMGILALADFNQDGKLDIVLGNESYPATILVYLGNGDGAFASSPITTSPQYAGGVMIVVGDFNEDGIPDVAVPSNNQGDLISILLGNGDGSFTEVPQTFTPTYDYYVISSLGLADFNSDGRPDVAVVYSSNNTVQALLVEPSQIATATVNGISPAGPGLHFAEASYPGDKNYNSSVSATTELAAKVATPVISPPSGIYTSVQQVSITDSTPGASIYYSTDGSIPDSYYSTLYTGPIIVQSRQTLVQAIAIADNYQQSTVAAANITLNIPAPAAPVISLPSGTYPGSQTVTISDTSAGSVIYYTTNGSIPTANSTLYTGPITVSSSETLVAIAANGYAISGPSNAQYLISSSASSFLYSIAGSGGFGYSGDGGPALLAKLNSANASLLDNAGNLYILDTGNHVIRKVTASSGVITTMAGNGTAGYTGDKGPATNAQFFQPAGMALDGQGNLYIADSGNNVVREVAAATGIITTVAGNGTYGYSGDGGPATGAQLYYPQSVSVDSAGNLFIADTFNMVIRKVAASSGTISTVAGNGSWGYTGDGGPATAASLREPQALALDGSGNLYITDTYSQVVREVYAKTGTISTVAGSENSLNGYSGDGGPATSAELSNPTGLALDNSGNLYIADTDNQVIREISATSGVISTVAGGAPWCTSVSGDGGPVMSAALCYPRNIFIGPTGNMYITSANWGRIRLATAPVVPPTSVTATPTFSIGAGTYASPQTVTITDSTPGAAIYVTVDGSTPTTAGQGYQGPLHVSGNVTIRAIAVAPGYSASTSTSAAYTITATPPSTINTVAGSGISGFNGSGGAATSTQFSTLGGMAIDNAGNLYFADMYNNVVWEVAKTTGTASVVAGSGLYGYSGDGGLATNATFNQPNSVAVDSAGNLYIADTYNNVIRKVTIGSGIISTVAGNGYLGYPSYVLGDGGPAVDAQLYDPAAVAVDGSGNLYIADTSHYRVRMVSASNGIINTIAGNGSPASNGDGGAATNAALGQPNALALDGSGNLYIATYYSGRVRKLALSSGIITTAAGNGNYYGSSGDGGPATAAEVYPFGLAVDSTGNLYISDWPSAVRVVSASTGIISGVAGNGYYGYSGDGGSSTIASLAAPRGITVDASGNLYFADSENYRVREISFSAVTPTPVIAPASGTYTSSQVVTITDSAKDAVIYYTTDGTVPTSASNVYTAPITISATTTLQAVAIAPGFAQSPVAFASYTIQTPVAPAITVTPSATSITTAQALTVAVAVTGSSGNPTPTGSVSLSSGSYSTNQNLASGGATFNVAAGALPIGATTLTVSYTPDAASEAYYTSGTQTAAVTVTQATGSSAAVVTLTPSAASITDQQPLSVAISIAGGSGQPAPTGSVTLSGGSYQGEQALSNGTTAFSIAAGAIGEGAITLTAKYSGDVAYAVATGTTVVTVAPVIIGISNPPSIDPGSSASATATFSAGSTYSGTMNLTCALTASPAGAQSLPTCDLNPTSVAIAAGGSATTTLTVKTTAASTNSAHNTSGPGSFWNLWTGSGALSLALILGVPCFRRRQFILPIVLFAVVAIGAVGCGGGGGSSTNPPPATPATTAGSYTFSLTGTDSSNPKTTTVATVVVTVK